MLALGYDAPREDVDAFFDSLDVNHDGTIEYTELNRALRRHAAIDKQLTPGERAV